MLLRPRFGNAERGLLIAERVGGKAPRPPKGGAVQQSAFRDPRSPCGGVKVSTWK